MLTDRQVAQALYETAFPVYRKAVGNDGRIVMFASVMVNRNSDPEDPEIIAPAYLPGYDSSRCFTYQLLMLTSWYSQIEDPGSWSCGCFGYGHMSSLLAKELGMSQSDFQQERSAHIRAFAVGAAKASMLPAVSVSPIHSLMADMSKMQEVSKGPGSISYGIFPTVFVYRPEERGVCRSGYAIRPETGDLAAIPETTPAVSWSISIPEGVLCRLQDQLEGGGHEKLILDAYFDRYKKNPVCDRLLYRGKISGLSEAVGGQLRDSFALSTSWGAAVELCNIIH